MAYSHGVTRDDVYSAASSIFAQGKNPTQAAVRKLLDRGSFSTISKYLQEWRQEQQDSGIDLGEGQSVPEEHLKQFQRFYWGLRSSVEATSAAEQIELLELENERLRQRQESYDAIAAELAGLKFAYQENLARLEQLLRENERLEQRLRETSLSSSGAVALPEEIKQPESVKTKSEEKPVAKTRRSRKSTTSTGSRSRKSTTKSVQPEQTWEQRVDAFVDSTG